jgi:dTDP-L-rhamnose 4-epimerase
VLLEALIERPVERLVVASSMSIYGEGLYRDADGALVARERTREQLERAATGSRAGATASRSRRCRRRRRSAVARLGLRALQVRPGALCLMFGARTASRPSRCASSTSTARGQALSNPYTGVLAIFASRCSTTGRR